MHDLRVVVFGYGELGLAALDTLAHLGVEPVAVVVPGNRQGRDVALVAAAAVARGHRVLTQPARTALTPFLDDVRALQPDLLLVWSYSMILPQALLDLPPFGAVNVHGGLLPEYRGGHVMQWAIINGETETGVTLHYMDTGVDTGPLIGDLRFPIQADDDAVRVRSKLKTVGEELLRRWWPQIAGGTAPRVPQDESKARHWPMRTREEGRIDWTQTNEGICRLVRGLACNEPGAFVEVDGTTVTIRSAHPTPSRHASQPGRVGSVESSGVRVSASAGDVLVTEVLVGGVVRLGASVADVLRPGASVLASNALRQHG